MADQWMLLAATVRDGDRHRRLHRLQDMDLLTVTPRTLDRARGASVRHVMATPDYLALPRSVRITVAESIDPALATHPRCAFCSSTLS